MFISSCEGSQQKEPLSACLSLSLSLLHSVLGGYQEIFSKDPERAAAAQQMEKKCSPRAHKKQFSASVSCI